MAWDVPADDAIIEKRRGEKPKPGTLYPALKDMHEKGLIIGEKRGKTVVYSLTSSGKQSVKLAREYFIMSFGDIIGA